MRVQSFTKAELGAFWNFWYFPHLFFGSPFPSSLGHLPSRSAYILSRAHVQGNLCLCLCFLFGSYTCFAQICGLPRRAGLMSDQDFFEQIRAIFSKIPDFCLGLNVDQKLKWKLIWKKSAYYDIMSWKIYDHPLRICLREIASWQEPKLGFCWQLWHCQTLGPFREPTVFS